MAAHAAFAPSRRLEGMVIGDAAGGAKGALWHGTEKEGESKSGRGRVGCGACMRGEIGSGDWR